MYFCIDMRSFFASVECSLRGLDPINVPLAVVDAKRGDGALVMAATPKLKEYGVPSRCRLYDIPKDIFFIKAKPRMEYYLYYAKRLHEIFLSFVAKEDCYCYSIDESFLKVDEYIKYFGGSPKVMALKILDKIKTELGIFATCGAGDNMYLSKVALDILAKKNHGYFYLTEKSFIELLWDHKPITDFWMIGPGTKKHLEKLGITCVREIAEANPKLIRKEFGVLGEDMILHAYGKDTTVLKDVLEYEPINKSLSKTQILMEDYKKEEAILPLLEMTFLLTIDMYKQNYDAKGCSFFVRYSKDYGGGCVGKMITFHHRHRDFIYISKVIKRIYDVLVSDVYPIRQVGVSFFSVKKIENRQLSLFYIEDERYSALCKTIACIHDTYGKNALVPAMALFDKSTMLYRNKCIGGHNGR